VVAAVGVGGEVGDAEVDAEESVRLLGRRVGDVAGGVQQPLAVPADQVRLAAAVRGQGGVLLVGAAEPDAGLAAGDGPDRHGAGSQLPGQAPVVERLRRVATEPDRFALGGLAAVRPWLAEVAGPDVGLQGGVRAGYLPGDVDGGLRGQTHVLQPAVGEPLQRLFGEHPPLVRQPGGDVRGVVAQVHSGPQRRLLGGIREQPDLYDDLHQASWSAA
jgi:hypothetical protein